MRSEQACPRESFGGRIFDARVRRRFRTMVCNYSTHSEVLHVAPTSPPAHCIHCSGNLEIVVASGFWRRLQYLIEIETWPVVFLQGAGLEYIDRISMIST